MGFWTQPFCTLFDITEATKAASGGITVDCFEVDCKLPHHYANVANKIDRIDDAYSTSCSQRVREMLTGGLSRCCIYLAVSYYNRLPFCLHFVYILIDAQISM